MKPVEPGDGPAPLEIISLPKRRPGAPSLAFDPHPHGCPIGLRATPTEMNELVIALCVRARELVHASIFVINPSKGQSYPVLFLRAAESAPAIAMFPAWEDDRRTRRSTYGRQVSLLQRISAAGVSGESLDSYAPSRPERTASGRGAAPLLVPLDAPMTAVTPLFRDLHERLGANLRMTMTAIPVGKDRGELPVWRCYAADEPRPRLAFFPGWIEPGDKQIVDQRRMELLLQRADSKALPELAAADALSREAG